MSNQTLLLGDCLDLLGDVEPHSIDMVLADPPYGTTACKWDSVIPLEPMWEHLLRVTKPNGAIVMTASQPFTTALISSNMQMFKYDMCWVKNKKTGFLNAKKQPLRAKEDVVVFYHRQPTYNPQMSTGHKPVNSYTKHTGDGKTMGRTKKGISGGGSTERYPTNVLAISVVNQDGSSPEGRGHPTQKPVALMEYLIKTYTREGDTILDFAMGSGTTGVAARNLGRNFVGIEKDAEHFATAQGRLLA